MWGLLNFITNKSFGLVTFPFLCQPLITVMTEVNLAVCTGWCRCDYNAIFAIENQKWATLYSVHTLDSVSFAKKYADFVAVRAVPEIILAGAQFFFRPLHPQDTHGVRAPRPPGHVSALINLPHYGTNTPWPPGQVTSPPPTPWTHCQQNTLHPQDKKVFAAPPRG